MNMTQPQKYLGLLVDVANDGSIKLPQQMLDTAGIKPGSKVEVIADPHHLYLRTVDEECEFCGTNGKMIRLGTKKICSHCVAELRRL